MKPMIAVAVLALSAASALAQTAEQDKTQVPAPQGTVAPESNAKANTGASTGTMDSQEQTNSQSPGLSEETDLSKTTKEGAANSGVSTNREATNPEVPAPNNTVRPQ